MEEEQHAELQQYIAAHPARKWYFLFTCQVDAHQEQHEICKVSARTKEVGKKCINICPDDSELENGDEQDDDEDEGDTPPEKEPAKEPDTDEDEDDDDKEKNANAKPSKNAMIFSRRSFDEKQLKKLSPEKQKKHTPTGERSVAEIMNRLETIKKFM